MANFRPIIISLLIVGLFAIAIITGGIMIANENGATQSIGNDDTISAFASSINNSLIGSYSNSSSAEDALVNSSITLTSGFPVFDAIGGLWKTLKVVPVTIYNLTIGLLFQNILGGQAYAIVIGVLGAILIITIIFAVWKLISTGEGG